MATIATLSVNLITKTSAFDRGMRKSQKSLSGFQQKAATTQKKLAGLAKGMMGFASIAGAGFALRSATRSFADFEKQLSMVSTMLDKQTMHLMPQYESELKRLAVKFGEGTETLSKGLYDILSASVAPEKALDVLTVATIAAKAGFSDTAVAADAITTVLNSYRLSAEQAGRVSDILFAIVKRGKTTFPELAAGIGKVASIASTAGLSLEELGAAIATLTRAGIQTDIAMTAIRSIINAFLKPTKDAAAAAEEFGIALNTSTLRGIGLVGVLEELKYASAEQIAAIIPNVRGLAGFAAALQGVEGQAEDLELILNSLGMTQEAYDKATNNLSTSLDRAKQAIKLLAVEIGSELRPAIEYVSDSLVMWRKIFKAEDIEDVSGQFGSISKEADRLAVGVHKLNNDLLQMTGFLNMSTPGMGRFANAANTTAKEIEGVADATAELTAQTKELEKQYKTWTDFAKRIYSETRTPLERYEQQVGKLHAAFTLHLIDWESYSRAIRQAREELEKTTRETAKTKTPSYAPRGGEIQEFRPAYVSVAGLSMGVGNNPGLIELRKIKAENQKQTALLFNIADKESLG